MECGRPVQTSDDSDFRRCHFLVLRLLPLLSPWSYIVTESLLQGVFMTDPGTARLGVRRDSIVLYYYDCRSLRDVVFEVTQRRVQSTRVLGQVAGFRWFVEAHLTLTSIVSWTKRGGDTGMVGATELLVACHALKT